MNGKLGFNDIIRKSSHPPAPFFFKSCSQILLIITSLSLAGSLQTPALEVTQAASTVAFLRWSQVKAASHYNLVIREQGHQPVDREPRLLTVFGEEVIVDELKPNSIYCVTVSAQTSVASGAESHPVCILTGHEETLLRNLLWSLDPVVWAELLQGLKRVKVWAKQWLVVSYRTTFRTTKFSIKPLGHRILRCTLL